MSPASRYLLLLESGASRVFELPESGELDGEAANTARSTMDQHPLPRREPRVVEESLPRCQGGERGCRGARMVEAAGFRGEVGSAHGYVLGRSSVPKNIGQPVDGTADLDISHVRCDSHDDAALEVQELALLRSRSVEGVVLCPTGPSSEHLTGFVGSRLPIVLVDRFFPDLPLPYVSSDNVSGARQATELLISSGHRRIACLQGMRRTSTNEYRVRGYREALSRHHLPVEEKLIVGDSFTEQSGYIETKLLLRTEPGVRAILALSNLNGLGAIRALTEEKRRIPDDVSIISFDDTPYFAYLATPLTAVAQANAEMGEVAVKLLFDQIQSPHRQTKGGILLPTTLVIRESVRRLQSPGS